MKTRYALLFGFLTIACLANTASLLAGDSKTNRKPFEGLPDNENENINKLLTYKGISADISLPPGAERLPFQVWFHKRIDPTNVIVTLNGEDVSELFVAEQGGSNLVELPLQEGPKKKVQDIQRKFRTSTIYISGTCCRSLST